MTRRIAALFTALLLAACAETDLGDPLPVDRLAFPTGLVIHPGTSRLYVVSSNFNLAFREGAVVALSLDDLQPGSVAALAAAGPRDFPLCGASGCPQRVLIDSFGGPAVLDATTERLFTASRGANTLSVIVLGPGGALACPDGAKDCAVRNVRVQLDAARAGRQKIIDPFAVAAGQVVTATGEKRNLVFVGQLRPPGEFGDETGTVPVAAVPADVSDADSDAQVLFTRELGVTAVSGLLVAPGERLIVSGRFAASGVGHLRLLEGAGTAGSALRLFDMFTGLKTVETRGMALSSDGRTLYVASRDTRSQAGGTDALAELVLNGPTDAAPMTLRRTVPLASGPSEIHVVPRPGKADLVVVSCPDAHQLLVYDAGAGAVVGKVRLVREGVGGSPFAMAHRLAPGGASAELFVSLFLDNRIAVVDLPLDAPYDARLAVHVGAPPAEAAAP